MNDYKNQVVRLQEQFIQDLINKQVENPDRKAIGERYHFYPAEGSIQMFVVKMDYLPNTFSEDALKIIVPPLGKITFCVQLLHQNVNIDRSPSQIAVTCLYAMEDPKRQNSRAVGSIRGKLPQIVRRDVEKENDKRKERRNAMSKFKRFISMALVLAMVLCLLPAGVSAEGSGTGSEATDYTKYVDPFVCTDVDYGQLTPSAMTPYPLVKVCADTYPHETNDHTGYDYSKTVISGFTHTRIEGVGGQGVGGDIQITPTYVRYTQKPSQVSKAMNIVKDGDGNKVEKAETGYYAVDLWPETGADNTTAEVTDSGSIKAELTADTRTAMHRYTMPMDGDVSVVVDLNYCYDCRSTTRDIIMNVEQLEDGRVAISGRFCGTNVSGNGKYTMYFYMETSQAVKAMSCWDGSGYHPVDTSKTYTGHDVGLVLTQACSAGDQLELQVTVSTVSAEQAKRDMYAEMAEHSWDFDTVRASAKAEWNAVLGRVKVTNSEAGDPDGELIGLFYTHLYHMFTMPMNCTSTDGTYRAIDSLNTVYVADGYTHYDSWSLWDDFKKYPMVGLIMPEVYADIVRSIADGLKAGFATWSHSHQTVMNVRTEHATALLADGVAKGVVDISNLVGAYEAAKKRSDSVSKADRLYRVDKMVEYSYDDWCISLLAEELYKQTGEEQYLHDYKKYAEQAFWYKELYRDDAVIPAQQYQEMVGMGEEAVGSDPMGLLWGKGTDGNWRSGNPETVGAQSLYQGSLWQYTFWATNDISGLMDLMGGRNAMYRELSYLMGEYAPENGSRMLHTSTNEIDLTSPYLFNQVGRPWRTQYWTRQIYAGYSFSSGYTGDGSSAKQKLYSLKPDGYLLGMDDDTGTMAAMYVAAAMGLIAMTPGDPTFQLTSPFFEEVRLDVGGGKEFVIKAGGVSADSYYIQSATLNGKEFNRTWLSYDEIARGGELCYQMGAEASTWGAHSPTTPSMSDNVDSAIYENEQLSYSTLTFEESKRNDGSTDTEIVISLNDEAVSLNVPAGTELTEAYYSISGVPEGMTAKLVCTDSTTLTLTLTGKANNHTISGNTDDVLLSLKDALFNGSVATDRKEQSLKVQFNDNEITYSSKLIEEREDGSYDTTIIATLTGTDTFVGSVGEDVIASGKLNVFGLPEGMNISAKLTGNTTVQLQFTGSMTGKYTDRDGLRLTFTDSAFAGGNASTVSGSNYGGMDALTITSASGAAEAELTMLMNELTSLVARAQRLTLSDYTETSVAALTLAVENAQSVLRNGKENTVEEVRTAYHSLAEALDALELIRLASERIELEDYDKATTDSGANGQIKTEACSDVGGTRQVANTFDGTWLYFGNVDFGEVSPSDVSIRYCCNSGRCAPDAYVEIYLDSMEGEPLATVQTPPTGASWSVYGTATTAIEKEVTGIHGVYVVMHGTTTGSRPYIGNFNWMEFKIPEIIIRDAYRKIEMETADAWTSEVNPANNGALKFEATSDSDEITKTQQVANTFDGAWLCYNKVDFGATGAKSVSIRYSSKNNCYSDGYVELRVGGVDGELVATINTPVTGSWSTYNTAAVELNAEQQALLIGRQDVYVVTHGTAVPGKIYVGNFNWMLFTEAEADSDRSAVAAVIALIRAIDNPVTMESKEKIDAARAAYNALTAEQKEAVTNYQTLLDAEHEYAVLVSEKNAEDAKEAQAAAEAARDAAEAAQQKAEEARKAAEEAKAAAEAAAASAAEDKDAAENAARQAEAAEAEAQKAEEAAKTAQEAAEKAAEAAKNSELEAAKDAQKAAEEAAKAAEEAATAAQSAEAAANAAEAAQAAQGKAEEARDAAEQAKKDAEDAAALAGESSDEAKQAASEAKAAEEAAKAAEQAAANAKAAAEAAADAAEASNLAAANAAADAAQYAAEVAQMYGEICEMKLQMAQYLLEAQKTRLDCAKYYALMQLTGYADKDDYAEAQQAELADAIEAGTDAIGAAESIEAVDKALADAKVAIDAIKTLADLEAEKPPFVDVAEDAWYYDAVKYVYNENLFHGTGETTFSPEGTMTRAMLVTVLYRMAGEPDVSDLTTHFTDLDAKSYYYNAVLWATENGITKGVDQTHFVPDMPVTREEMVTFLHRYATLMDMDVTARAELTGFSDADKVSAYAVDAMAWAVAAKLVQGTDNNVLAPQDTATRAQVATILCRFLILKTD